MRPWSEPVTKTWAKMFFWMKHAPHAALIPLLLSQTGRYVEYFTPCPNLFVRIKNVSNKDKDRTVDTRYYDADRKTKILQCSQTMNITSLNFYHLLVAGIVISSIFV